VFALKELIQIIRNYDSLNKENILSKFRFCCDFRYLKYEEFDDTKGVIRIRILKKTTQWPKEKGQRTKNNLQSRHIKLKISNFSFNIRFTVITCQHILLPLI
jgi:hypothetical protein